MAEVVQTEEKKMNMAVGRIKMENEHHHVVRYVLIPSSIRFRFVSLHPLCLCVLQQLAERLYP